MKQRTCLIPLIIMLLVGCAAPLKSPLASERSFTILSGEAAIEPAYLNFKLVDQTGPKPKYTTQDLPTDDTWTHAQIRLHSKNGTQLKLTADRVMTIARAPVYENASFTHLRPGSYVLQVALLDASGLSVAAHSIDLPLQGGAVTTVAVTMKTTNDATKGSATTFNAAVSNDVDSLARSMNYLNSVTGVNGVPVIVEEDTIRLNPTLADTGKTGSGTANGEAVSSTDNINPGVMSRVVLSYAPSATVIPATSEGLVAGEVLLADWLRGGSEPVSGSTWASLAENGDGGWPTSLPADHVAVGTTDFDNTFDWVTGTFANASATETATPNYKLVFRFYDNTRDHNLIAIKTHDLIVLKAASFNVSVN